MARRLRSSRQNRRNSTTKPRFKVAGCVVLYNPDPTVLDNIASYANQVKKLYIVDNSENPNLEFINKLKIYKHSVIIQNNANLGIAAALNIAANSALKDKFDFLLTMDQDTSVPPDMVNNLLCTALDAGYNLEEVGIISPFQRDASIEELPEKAIDNNLLYVITSGNLLNLEVYSKVGGFLEKLFIDRVDHEYCLRLNMNNYKILRINTITVNHTLGSISKHKFINTIQYTTNHSPIRRYYIVRNILYLRKIYGNIFPDYTKSESAFLFYDLLKIILFEKWKLKKLKYFLKGYIDSMYLL
jgi:rhamnosyltransferase